MWVLHGEADLPGRGQAPGLDLHPACLAGLIVRAPDQAIPCRDRGYDAIMALLSEDRRVFLAPEIGLTGRRLELAFATGPVARQPALVLLTPVAVALHSIDLGALPIGLALGLGVDELVADRIEIEVLIGERARGLGRD